jgi:ActR/RegA family two-component response regulator
MVIKSTTRLLVIDQDTLGENNLKQTLNPNAYEVITVKSSSEGLQTSQSWYPEDT